MVTSVQLGNFFSSGGKTVLGGVGGSGLDTESLVTSLSDAKRLPAVRLEDTITANGKKTEALAEFKTLLSTLKDAASFLRNPPGVGNQAQNAFLYTSATIISNTSTSADNYISITSSPGVTPATYNITEINSVAAAKQQGTVDITITDADTAFVTASSTANRFTAGTVTINGENITLETGDTLNQVAAKFNAFSDDLGFTTSVIKVADGTFQLTFTANATGEEADFDLNSGTFVTAGAAVFNGFVFDDRQDASNAEFIVNGVTITRQNNSISDVFSGVTFTLKQDTLGAETPATIAFTATIVPDTSIVKNAVINFINAYNDLRIFAAKQVEVDDNGQYKDTAVLANSSVFRNTVSSVTSALAQVVSGLTGGGPSRLSDVGVTFADLPASSDNPQVRNILDLNEGTLTAKLAEDYDAFRRVFEFDLQTSNPNLRVFSRTNALAVSSFTLNVGAATPPALPTVTATYSGGGAPINLTVTAIKDNSTGDTLGYSLTGQDGTVLEGLQLIYASTSADTITVTTTQGLADKLYGITDSTLTQDTGALDVEVDAIVTADERLQEQIDRIDEQVERFRQQLLDKFAQLEQAVARVNNLLAAIDAQDQTRFSS
ncbi:MAG: flagellar filament capping protein FliD [Alphaproteobacteria bacterium]|nr:flagellar filament capping protein FliD [Alphaproteobacteria bacterium]